VVELAIPEPGDGRVARQGIGPNIGVLRLDDRRREPQMLGLKIGRLGALDSSVFVVSGADVGQSAADALAAFLKGKGWVTSAIRNGSPGATDVIVSGEVVELSVNARSAWFSTEVTAKVALLLEAENQADGSKIRMTVGSEGSDHVYWFDPKLAQTLINDVLTESYAKWVSGTKVEGRSLRLK
jgi:hypothetical protein